MASAACEGSVDSAVDYISDLSDDLLLHVLRLVSDDGRDVVCTSVLSRRWRNLWTRAPVLRLGNWNRNGQRAKDNNAQFNDFVQNVLARRAYGDTDIDTLELRARLWPGKSRAELWLSRAMRHTATSLVFDMPRRRRSRGTRYLPDKLRPRLSLPGSTRLTTMSLELNYGVLLLPPAVDFHALTELALTAIWFSDDDGPRLGHLLSPSCCPRLRKLTLSHLHGLHDLRLDGGELENLYLADLDVRRLGVYTPRLLALTVEAYFMHQQNSEHTSLTIRAPGLEKLEYTLMLGGIQLELQHYTIHLMQECRPSDGHTLYLYVPEKLTKQDEDEPMIEIPQLPSVTNLTIKYGSKNSHYMGATVTSLLARCSNLEYLYLDNQIHQKTKYDPGCEEGCDDCSLRGSWKDNVISLEHLREVKLGGFSGKEHYCLDMVQLLLLSAPALERIDDRDRQGIRRILVAPKINARTIA